MFVHLFKLKKFESLFYKINTCYLMHVQKTTFGNPVDIPRRFNVYKTSMRRR